jgi:hypothetical protein
MRLHAVLSWFDESPTWLAATVASCAKLGVDHVLAVDGSYRHFSGEARSGAEQAEAITLAAHSVGMGVTVVQPNEKLWTEVGKRAACFKMLEAFAEPMVDWCFVIDGDELVTDGSEKFKRDLAAVPGDTHCAAARIHNALDPFAEPSADNDVSAKTAEIYRKMPVDPRGICFLQSRFWRVMHNMTVRGTHWNYFGTDAEGVEWNIRPDIGNQHVEGFPKTEIAQLDSMPTLEHRKNWRTKYRREQKAAYYAVRDELGLEQVAVSPA